MNTSDKINNRFTSGFTVVELISVIVVMGILATIGVISFSEVQARSRDSQRSSSVNIIAESLERYYEKNGEYPSCNEQLKINDVDLGNIDKNVLLAPGAGEGANSLVCGDVINSSQFTYNKNEEDGSWTLSYKSEVDDKTVSIANRRKVAVAGSNPAGASSAINTKIKLKGGTDIITELGYSYYSELGAQLYDDSDKEILDAAVSINKNPDNFDEAFVGDYTIIYSYLGEGGKYGAADTVTRTVHVVDSTPPEWSTANTEDKHIAYGDDGFDLDGYVNDNFIAHDKNMEWHTINYYISKYPKVGDIVTVDVAACDPSSNCIWTWFNLYYYDNSNPNPGSGGGSSDNNPNPPDDYEHPGLEGGWPTYIHPDYIFP